MLVNVIPYVIFLGISSAVPSLPPTKSGLAASLSGPAGSIQSTPDDYHKAREIQPPTPNLQTPPHVNSTSPFTDTTIHCTDPPLPRERFYPVTHHDCSLATPQIIGHRNKFDPYIFTRHPPVPIFGVPYHYYPLPARYSHGTCVVLLDLDDEDDRKEDAVMPTVVEATAWVLGQKCGGAEEGEEENRWGGWTKVGMRTRGIIGVWVYGRRWPPQPLGLGSENATIGSVA